MNADVLRAEHPHVQEEHEKLRGLIQVEERALMSAVGFFLDAARGELEMPEGAPALDAPAIDWIDFFLIRTATDLAVLAARDRVAAEAQPTLFEAVAA